MNTCVMLLCRGYGLTLPIVTTLLALNNDTTFALLYVELTPLLPDPLENTVPLAQIMLPLVGIDKLPVLSNVQLYVPA